MARRTRSRRLFSLRPAVEQLESRDLLAGLLHQADLNYLGAFKVPDGNIGASTFEYGGTALTYNPGNDSLFMVGHDWDQAIAEISIPEVRNGSLSNLSTANVIQPFVNVQSRIPSNDLEGDVKVGGLLVNGNQLIGSLYEFYDANENATDSHFKLSSLNLSTANASGMFEVGNLGGGFVGGYMGTVPAAWQSALGTQYLTGQAGLSIIDRTSAGPAVFGFDPAQLGTNPAPTTNLVYYPLSSPLADEQTQNPLFNTTTEIRGVVFPEGTDTVLFIGSHGTGSWCYATGDICNDPYRPDQGPHAAPYVYQVWAYNANDLLAVKNGQLQPWQVRPYDVWTFDLPYPENSKHIGGVAYDAASGRIYVSQQLADDAKPVIHVFQVAPSDTQPPVITDVGSSNAATATTITWTTNKLADSQVEFGTTSTYGSNSSLDAAPVNSHATALNGLNPNTTYHFRVKSRDGKGNLGTSTDFTFTTAALDTTAPTISGVNASGITASGAIIGWTTNEPSDTQIEYGVTASFGNSTALDSSQVANHTSILSGLTANATYYYRVKSRDAAGNLAISGTNTFTTANAATIYSYSNPAPLPPSNPATTINVSTVTQLISAVNNLRTGQTINIAAGTYNLSGATDGLYIPAGITDWSIRGATGKQGDVVIRGGGMSGAVRFGFWIGASPRGTIADLTIDGVRQHGIIANAGAHNLLVHGVRIVDSGDQFIKSNPNASGLGNNNGVVEYSTFEYRTTDNDNYTNGVDVHGGDGWIVRYNLFKNILSPAGQGLAGPAVLMWEKSKNSSIEGNTFINVARGVALGLVDQTGAYDHQGGSIQNNMFYRDPGLASAVDVAIYLGDSPSTKIYHNTVLTRGTYPNAIEYRFASTSGVEIKNNLTDAAIVARDGASATVTGNITTASLGYFVNPSMGDLHLVAGAYPINRGLPITGFTLDEDGQIRDGLLDVGADEYKTSNPVIPTKFYVVNDSTTNQTFEYDSQGGLVESYALNSGNSAPRGAASTAAGTKTWVLDANRRVYVYDNGGVLLGSWLAGTLATTAAPQGIATNGTDIWIADATSDRVYMYFGAAARLSGTQNATSNFKLTSGNGRAEGIVTDGTSLWVVNDDNANKVFKYSLAGALLGSWRIDPANSAPSGLTIDPSNPQHIWIVDRDAKKVFQYSNAVGRISGNQLADATFALAASNSNPEDIADPPSSQNLESAGLSPLSTEEILLPAGMEQPHSKLDCEHFVISDGASVLKHRPSGNSDLRSEPRSLKSSRVDMAIEQFRRGILNLVQKRPESLERALNSTRLTNVEADVVDSLLAKEDFSIDETLGSW